MRKSWEDLFRPLSEKEMQEAENETRELGFLAGVSEEMSKALDRAVQDGNDQFLVAFDDAANIADTTMINERGKQGIFDVARRLTRLTEWRVRMTDDGIEFSRQMN